MLRIFVLVCMGLLCSGCALITDKVDIPYQSLAQPAIVPGSHGVTVSVTTADVRTAYRDRVSSKKNGYGMEMAPIVASNDIPTAVTTAFQQELSARGFQIGSGDVSLQIELTQFYNDFKIGLFSGTADANVAFNTKIVAANGDIAFAKYYQGHGIKPNIELANGGNARDALIKAFQAAVASAMNDPDFIHALLKAGAAAPVR